MRRCLSCDGRFDDRRRICPGDGDVLIAEGRPASETGHRLAGKYRLGNLIGEGGMGQVFDAVCIDSGAPVAIKLLRPGVADSRVEKRFRREAEALGSLDHPGVVKILDFGTSRHGLTYMVMERLLGPTFHELRRAGKFASTERVVALVREACEVVASAHARGIVHRDIKPSNLLLHRLDSARSQVKVLDFGIAKFLDGFGDSLTRTGELVGTLQYMAPEQTRGGAVGPEADVYSLGLVLFEALAGRLPFTARNPVELIRVQATSPAPAISSFRPDVWADLDGLVARCLAKKPSNRFPNAAELAQALSAAGPGRNEADALSGARTGRVNPSLWVGSILDDRYELHEWLAPGRFGSHVYLATHLRTGASVAVRFWGTGRGSVRDLLLEAFQNEARAMGVRHPNVIAILDLGYNDDGVYIVTEFVPGCSLRELLDRRGALSPALARELAAGAAEGLGTLHAHQIVSGGLSPETIRISGPAERPERMLLSPFGLSNLKQVEALVEALGPDSEGDCALDYISPEQRAGAPPEPRSDLYSLGLILLEMLGGQVRESFLPTTETLGPLTQHPSPPPSPAALPVPVLPESLSERWRAFLDRATALRPETRFQSASEFEAALPSVQPE